MFLTQQQVRDYKTNGFITGIRVANEVEARHYRELFDQLEVKEGREKCQIGLVDRHFDQQFIWGLATHPQILDCISDLIGPDVLLLATHFFCKYGPQEKFVAWHQDVTYWGLEPAEAITAWFAIDDSDCGNGCMSVIPGSHRDGIQEHGKSDQEGNLLSINQEVPISREDENCAVDLVLKAGEMSIHHGTIIHGSLPNRSTRRRCGLTIRYVPPWVRQIEENSMKRRSHAILLRGQDQEKNFGECPTPFSIN
ncbi:TPA: phytanoyl-CoA dioxygenase [Candidatus Poribacteria bacterium]|nr:phytanoyl-CoA dioxygenase [Candidatus Poribacteria bacterium]HIC00002.1 phytanoyl-CoA dioxygenase [Candidatus Poribacteria bacterium]HIM12977.1 phytanoyl-CoA dioxygenase [Candidatus Poribacteria bacterium]HIO07721.1 phytanoyl-CoA dioxygenase [Candidatus Poribacteria bacterium]HIO49179.1 phytanoyl-CoA dioxygenase [Candidatus Poribacteria bacterium]